MRDLPNPYEPPDAFRASGNAHDRRKALRAHLGRCVPHGKQVKNDYGCQICEKEASSDWLRIN